jgi:EAL domain-containing protein (putative c-di-GMP-specific phosphodiesterase class I)
LDFGKNVARRRTASMCAAPGDRHMNLCCVTTGLRRGSRWLEKGLRAPRVAINVSAVQLRRKDFVGTFGKILKLAGAEAGIDIEVTESLIMEDVQANIQKREAIRQLGVGIAIDDFGTGYS